MATELEREEALQLRSALGENIPAGLRGPLLRVYWGEEEPGTAEDVLGFARDALARDRAG